MKTPDQRTSSKSGYVFFLWLYISFLYMLVTCILRHTSPASREVAIAKQKKAADDDLVELLTSIKSAAAKKQKVKPKRKAPKRKLLLGEESPTNSEGDSTYSDSGRDDSGSNSD